MGRTPDRFSGTRYEEEVQFEDRTADGAPVVAGAIRYGEGGFQGRDEHGAAFNFRDAFIRRRLTHDVTVPTDTSLITRSLRIGDGVNVTIQDGGELYVL